MEWKRGHAKAPRGWFLRRGDGVIAGWRMVDERTPASTPDDTAVAWRLTDPGGFPSFELVGHPLPAAPRVVLNRRWRECAGERPPGLNVSGYDLTFPALPLDGRT